jgi:hypothetical protein
MHRTRRTGCAGNFAIRQWRAHLDFLPIGRTRSGPGPMPASLSVTAANLVYFEKACVLQPLLNRLIRLAAFPNPEFFKAQAMRFPVWDKPRIIGCAESHPQHIALPRGCLDAARKLLRDNEIRCTLHDERFSGKPIDVTFSGTLRADQEEAVTAMLRHDSSRATSWPIACPLA